MGFVRKNLRRRIKRITRTLAIAQIPAKRLGEADETASLCVFLCSPGARYINGSDLVVDGGNGLASWVPLIEPA